MDILLVEDNKETSDYLQEKLTDEGFAVSVCASADEVFNKRLELNHDLIILDLMLDKERGDKVVKQLRKKKNNIPILVLSSLVQTSTKVDLFTLGADDYMTKPFNFQELMARIRALHRRTLETRSDDGENYGEITFYWKQSKLIRKGKEIRLTNKEGDLLKLLLRNEGKTVRSEDILQKVWQINKGHHSNILQSMVRRLRKKLDAGFGHALIRSVHGVGYCLVLPGKN